MTSEYRKKATQCCTREYDRLVEELALCDKKSKTASDRHRCYRLAARSSGHRAKRCISVG